MKKHLISLLLERNAETLAKKFEVFYWDGGLGQYIEQDFIENYGLSLDDANMSEDGVVINMDNAKER